MTDGTSSPLPQPGWYPDHAGGTGLRWWDGTQWTDHVSAPIAAQPYTAAGPLRNTVPATTPVGNVFIWLIVLLPVVSIVLSLLVNYSAFINEYRDLIRQAVEDPNSPPSMSGLAVYSDPFLILGQVWAWISIALSAVFGYLDSRRLRATGFERPFPWGWAFIPIVYVIGRSVVVRRRSGRGLAPLFVYLALVVISLIIGVVITVNVTNELMSSISDLSNTGSFS